jgi:ankyrin repeat protein
MPRVTRELTSRSTLDSLRKQAKRWLKDIEAGDQVATARFRDIIPGTAPPKLRELQHALANEYGFNSWAALKQELEDRARTHADRINLFLEKGVHRFGTDPRTGKWGGYERDGDYRGAMAARLLARHPDIAKADIHTAVLAHDIDAVRAFLAKDPSLANHRHAFDGQRPLARLAYARIPIPAIANALPIAELLLDAGASAQAAGADDMKSFTLMTGAIGHGEGDQSPHPQAEALVRLLIARGADPLDGQALYNTSLGPDDPFWMDLMWTECLKQNQDMARWHVAIPDTLGPPLEYLLGNAVNQGHTRRIAWLLERGADPNTTNFYSKLPVIRHAAMSGRQDIVDMLVKHGATRPQLTGPELFIAAVEAADHAALRRMAAEHPDYLRHAGAMQSAIRRDDVATAELLLDLGMSPDIGDGQDFRALHSTTHAGAIGIAKLLIARGAEVDAIEQRYKSTALGHAVYQVRPDMVALLAPFSRDIASLCWGASTGRLRALLSEDRTLANKPGRWGEPPLFCLPDDEERAVDVIELLLAFGADRTARNKEGLTPAEACRKRGFEDAASLLDPQTPD